MQRLAALERHELGQASRSSRKSRVATSWSSSAALDGRMFSPVALSGGGGTAGAAHVLRRGLDDLVDLLERGRVLDGAALRLRAVDPLTVDEEMRVRRFHGRRAISSMQPIARQSRPAP